MNETFILYGRYPAGLNELCSDQEIEAMCSKEMLWFDGINKLAEPLMKGGIRAFINSPEGIQYHREYFICANLRKVRDAIAETGDVALAKAKLTQPMHYWDGFDTEKLSEFIGDQAWAEITVQQTEEQFDLWSMLYHKYFIQ